MDQKKREKVLKAFDIAIAAIHFADMITMSYGGKGIGEEGDTTKELMLVVRKEFQKEYPDIDFIKTMVDSRVQHLKILDIDIKKD